jgi:hypothetical protein
MPGMFEHMHESTSGVPRLMAEDIATDGVDMRMRIIIQYEACFHDFYTSKSFGWNKSPSRIGYHHSFKIRDVPDQVHMTLNFPSRFSTLASNSSRVCHSLYRILRST